MSNNKSNMINNNKMMGNNFFNGNIIRYDK